MCCRPSFFIINFQLNTLVSRMLERFDPSLTEVQKKALTSLSESKQVPTKAFFWKAVEGWDGGKSGQWGGRWTISKLQSCVTASKYPAANRNFWNLSVPESSKEKHFRNDVTATKTLQPWSSLYQPGSQLINQPSSLLRLEKGTIAFVYRI